MLFDDLLPSRQTIASAHEEIMPDLDNLHFAQFAMESENSAVLREVQQGATGHLDLARAWKEIVQLVAIQINAEFVRYFHDSEEDTCEN